MNILHLTDLHIDEPNGLNEALRSGHYHEYLDDLIHYAKENSVNAIFVTGDIVNISKFKNYPHASKVLEYIAKEIGISKKDIFLTNGNHDVPRDTGAMTEFENFTKSFDLEKDLVCKGDRFKLYKIGVNDLILTLDSIGSEFSTGRPGDINSLCDLILRKVREQKADNIYVLSHHPVESYEVQALAINDEGIGWTKEHMWPSGGVLFRRLAKRPNISDKIFWFSGDIHTPEYIVIDNKRIVVTTGSCNYVGGYTGSNILPNARVVFSESYDESKLYEYKLKTHHGTHLEGDWVEVNVQARTMRGNSNDSNALPKIIKPEIKVKKIENKKYTLLDHNLEKIIISEVSDKNLYHFGRFNKDGDKTALFWISLTHLLQSQAIYSQIVQKFKDIIKTNTDKSGITKDDCLLIGIDNWGSILASRLGAATNLRSCCIAVRGEDSAYDPAEIINQTLKNIVSRKKIVFVISDVIATGNTVYSIVESLGLKRCDELFNLSIFLDSSQDRDDNLLPFNHNYYLCGSLKTPIIETKKLAPYNIGAK